MPSHVLVQLKPGEYLDLKKAFEERPHEVQDILYELILSVNLPTCVLSLLRVVSIFRDRLEQNEALQTAAKERIECVLNACRQGANPGSLEELFYKHGQEFAVIALYIATTNNSKLFNDIEGLAVEDQLKLIHGVIRLPQQRHIATFVNDLKKSPLSDVRKPLRFSRPRGRQKERQQLTPPLASIRLEASLAPQSTNKPSLISQPTNPSNPSKRKRSSSREPPHQADPRLSLRIDAELLPQRTLPPLPPMLHLNTAPLYNNLQDLPFLGDGGRYLQDFPVMERPSLQQVPQPPEQMTRPDTQAASQQESHTLQYTDGRDKNSWGEGLQFNVASEYIDGRGENSWGEESRFNVPLEQMARPDTQAASQQESHTLQYTDGRDKNSWGEGLQFNVASEYIDGRGENSWGEESRFNVPLEQMARPDTQAASQQESHTLQYTDGRDKNSWGEGLQFNVASEYIDGRGENSWGEESRFNVPSQYIDGRSENSWGEESLNVPIEQMVRFDTQAAS
ncbi:hypothetical protein V501_00508 [Pseudogymnoascus sp. VKM F-4519 (FW-2642)]|nr:hypothetical protein V501_00508 [Pseudogymnoascus sp. VKM F-4519 (FW-2642)]